MVCRARCWYQGSLAASDKVSNKPGPGAIQSAELGAKQTNHLETGILQQHQGRNLVWAEVWSWAINRDSKA